MGSSNDYDKDKKNEVIDQILEEALRGRKDADKTFLEREKKPNTSDNYNKIYSAKSGFGGSAETADVPLNSVGSSMLEDTVNSENYSDEAVVYDLKEKAPRAEKLIRDEPSDKKAEAVKTEKERYEVKVFNKPKRVTTDTIMVDVSKSERDLAEETGDEVKIYQPPNSSGAFQETRQFTLDSGTSKKLAVQRRMMQVMENDGADELEQLDIEALLIEAGIQQENKAKQKSEDLAEAQVSKIADFDENIDLAEERKADFNSSKWEEEFHKSREKKADKFKLSFKIAGEEEKNEPEEEYHEFLDEELDDYKSYDETSDVKAGLRYRKRMAWFRFLITLGITGFLFVLTIISQLGVKISPYFEAGAGVFLVLVALIINHMTVGIGFRELFKFSPSSETVAAVPSIIIFLHTLCKFFPQNIHDEKYILWSALAAGALLYSSIGELFMIKRIVGNFKFVSYPQDKYALKTIENDSLAVEVGRNSVALGTPSVAYTKKTSFLSHFLENSYERDVSDRACGIFSFIALAVSLVAAVLYGVVHKSAWRGFSAFVLTLSFSLPLGAMTSSHLPIYRVSKRILRFGGMLIGWQAARDFGEVHALVVDAKELFPSDNVLLHGIKTFSGTRIDKAILDAAAVSIEAGGPLAFVFRRIIQENESILPDVDTVVFEQDMGVSGWVDGRRVLIGNRTLLENHGVDTPSKDYEAKYSVEGRKLVYLSVAGELSSMFVVSYIPDMNIARSLDSLARADVTLLVRTSDPNITEEFLCDVYDLDDYYVEVMKASAGRGYDSIAVGKSERSEAVAASNGRLEGTAYAIAGCRNLGKSVRLGVIIQIVGAALGLALALLFVLFTAIVPTPFVVFGYTFFWVILSWLVPMGYRC